MLRRTHARPRDCSPAILTEDYEEADVPISGEVLFAAELVLLHAAPVYYVWERRTETVLL